MGMKEGKKIIKGIRVIVGVSWVEEEDMLGSQALARIILSEWNDS